MWDIKDIIHSIRNNQKCPWKTMACFLIFIFSWVVLPKICIVNSTKPTKPTTILFVCCLTYIRTKLTFILFTNRSMDLSTKIYLMNVSFLPHSSFPYQITSLSFTHKKISAIPSNILIVCNYINLQTRGQTTKSTNDMANKMIKLRKK